MMYEATVRELEKRIEALVPEHPEILTMDNAFELFTCGLKCEDLQPSYMQAAYALQSVQRRHERKV